MIQSQSLLSIRIKERTSKTAPPKTTSMVNAMYKPFLNEETELTDAFNKMFEGTDLVDDLETADTNAELVRNCRRTNNTIRRVQGEDFGHLRGIRSQV